MIRQRGRWVVAATLLLHGGCSIVGDWNTVEVIPPQYADRVLSTVTFGTQGLYTATTRYDGQAITSTGEYVWNGSLLRIQPTDGGPREYRGKLTFSKQLILHHKTDDAVITVKLEKQKP